MWLMVFLSFAGNRCCTYSPESCTEEKMERRPGKTAHARRNLFGPVDHKQLQQDFQHMLHNSVKGAQQKWKFPVGQASGGAPAVGRAGGPQGACFLQLHGGRGSETTAAHVLATGQGRQQSPLCTDSTDRETQNFHENRSQEDSRRKEKKTDIFNRCVRPWYCSGDQT